MRQPYWWESAIEWGLLPFVLLGVAFIFPAAKVIEWNQRRRGIK